MDEENLQPVSLPMVNETKGTDQDNIKIQELESRLENVELDVKTISAEVDSLPMVNQDNVNTVGNTDQTQIINNMLNPGNDENLSLTEQLSSVPTDIQELPSQNIQRPAKTASIVQTQQEQGIANTLKTLLTNLTQTFTRAVQSLRNKENELVDTDKETQAELKRSDEKTISTIANLDMSVKVKDEPKNTFHWTDALLLAIPIILSAAKKIWQGIGQCLMNVIAFIGPISEAIGLPWEYRETMNYLASKFGINYSSPQTIQKEKEKETTSTQETGTKPQNPVSSSPTSEQKDSSEDKSSQSSSTQTSTPEKEQKTSSSVDTTPTTPTAGTKTSSSSSVGDTSAVPAKGSQPPTTPVSSSGGGNADEAVGDETDTSSNEQTNTPTSIKDVVSNIQQGISKKEIKTSKPVEKEDGLLSWMGDLFGLGGILGKKVTDEQARQHGFVNAEDMKRQYKLHAEKKEEQSSEPKLKDGTETIPESKNNVNAKKIQDERNSNISNSHFSNESISETNNLDLSKNNKAKNNQQKHNEETKEYFIAQPAAKDFPILNKKSFYKYKPTFFKPA